jgi:hypothetical protein
MYPTLLYCPEVEGELTNLDFFFVEEWRVESLMLPMGVSRNGEMEIYLSVSHPFRGSILHFAMIVL